MPWGLAGPVTFYPTDTDIYTKPTPLVAARIVGPGLVDAPQLLEFGVARGRFDLRLGPDAHLLVNILPLVAASHSLPSAGVVHIRSASL